MRIAYRNRLCEWRQIVVHENKGRADRTKRDEVFNQEVLVEHFGWRWRWKYSPRDGSHWHNFSRDEIGHKKYSSAYAALSRATGRLLKRRLLALGRWGYNLTERGVRRCAEMFPKEADQVATEPPQELRRLQARGSLNTRDLPTDIIAAPGCASGALAARSACDDRQRPTESPSSPIVPKKRRRWVSDPPYLRASRWPGRSYVVFERSATRRRRKTRCRPATGDSGLAVRSCLA